MFTELIPAGKLGRIALGDVVHDRPLVIEAGPRSPPSGHFENDTAERPDINGAMAASIRASDDLWGHVHWRSGHGALTPLTSSTSTSKSLALSCNDFSGSEINEFEDPVMIQQNVYTSQYIILIMEQLYSLSGLMSRWTT